MAWCGIYQEGLDLIQKTVQDAVRHFFPPDITVDYGPLWCPLSPRRMSYAFFSLAHSSMPPHVLNGRALQCSYLVQEMIPGDPFLPMPCRLSTPEGPWNEQTHYDLFGFVANGPVSRGTDDHLF